VNGRIVTVNQSQWRGVTDSRTNVTHYHSATDTERLDD